jgi:hypothetical protein
MTYGTCADHRYLSSTALCFSAGRSYALFHLVNGWISLTVASAGTPLPISGSFQSWVSRKCLLDQSPNWSTLF